MSICLKIRSVIEFLLDVDPIAFSFWFFDVHWYALSYVCGILFVYLYIGKVGRYLPDKKQLLETLTSWMVLGAVLGGRIAYVLLYNPGFYIQYPFEIIKIWHGGMSFHGGIVGAVACTWIVCRKHNVSFLPLTDMCACSAPVGIFLGRIANLINGELYGKVTESCIGVVFSTDGKFLPRHPSQIYEAFCEGFMPFVALNLLFRYTKIKKYPGVLSSVFVFWYCAARCTIELFREPDAHIGYVVGDWITVGMILSVLALGLWVAVYIAVVKSSGVKTTD
ncbi:prolipoprotein diacylglyceryl transferase [Candidatus Anaplasma sp. TIGMIC]|uniref:prolipoprotein diacylglyceryl transferase n=1 Tax=Candidatus Anaplasma sp. TIGMIC TaxID=3020713 RepID=UPI00232EA34C|nr:prolipoprotein diacylglyceryl transferase [Candidatus Anaplasma sp. TIGMIC]MDB1135463.1 prolipoprotein diacylglyceryl transferase [Candidatus Anaplasma sp. TIGMIC]